LVAAVICHDDRSNEDHAVNRICTRHQVVRGKVDETFETTSKPTKTASTKIETIAIGSIT